MFHKRNVTKRIKRMNVKRILHNNNLQNKRTNRKHFGFQRVPNFRSIRVKKKNL